MVVAFRKPLFLNGFNVLAKFAAQTNRSSLLSRLCDVEGVSKGDSDSEF